MKRIVLFFLCAALVLAQTTINGGRTITGAWDASGAVTTKSCKSGTTAPGTCAVGECFFDTDATAGSNLFGCTATNTWTQLGGSGGGYATVDDEDTPLTQRTTINFAGAGVTCADDTNQTTCTIPGLSATTIRQTFNFNVGACDNAGANKSWGQFGNDDANGAAGACDNITGALSFVDAATGKRSYASLTLPPNWSSGDEVSALLWVRPNSYQASKQTKFYVETACRSSGESSSFSYNTAASVLRSINGDENNVLLATVSNIPMTNCSAGELMRVRVRRADSADAEDTYDSATVYITGFQLRYKVTVD